MVADWTEKGHKRRRWLLNSGGRMQRANDEQNGQIEDEHNAQTATTRRRKKRRWRLTSNDEHNVQMEETQWVASDDGHNAQIEETAATSEQRRTQHADGRDGGNL